MKQWSLRVRLMVWSAATVAVTLILFGAGAAWNLQQRLLQSADQEMQAEAEDFFDTLEKNTIVWTDRAQVEYYFDIPQSFRFVEVDRADGTILYRSRNLDKANLQIPRSEDFAVTVTSQGRSVRFVQFRENNIILRLGEDTQDRESIVTNLLAAYVLALPIVLLAIAVGGWWISRQALAPIETIIARANSLTASRLDERLPRPEVEDEIGRLTLVLNTMFDRLEFSFRQVARFTWDASHELKTPLSIIRGEIEAALQSGSFSGEQEKVLLSLLEETTHLSKIIANLLLLSRADTGELKLEIKHLDVSAMISEVVEDMEIAAAPRSITIKASQPPDLHASADPYQLRQVLLNLFDNAIKYNYEGGKVEVSLRPEDGGFALTIANTGHGIRPEQVRYIFQRFFRGDSTHGGLTEGHGLGLSICSEIARAHEGSLELTRSDDEWTEFRLTLPDPSRLTPKGQVD